LPKQSEPDARLLASGVSHRPSVRLRRYRVHPDRSLKKHKAGEAGMTEESYGFEPVGYPLPDSGDAACRQEPTPDARESDRDKAPASAGWNTSTMCLRVIHGSMLAKGWASKHVEIPLAAGGGDELPRRPLDIGEGLWR
jgi:hypothetical protein